MKCKSCGQEYKGERKYCGKCGKPLRNICPLCGFENEEDDTFCGSCGADMRKETEDTPDEEVSVAPGAPGGRGLKVDLAKLLHIPEEKKAEQPDKMHEEHKKESPEKANMSQEQIQRLFEEKEKKAPEQPEQKEARPEVKPEEKERGVRYVDKNHPSVLDSPITQDELDRLLGEFKKRHKG